MSGAKTAVAEHYMTTGSFPANNEAAGLATTITGKYVEKVDVVPLINAGAGDSRLGVILVVFRDSAHTKIAGGTMGLEAIDEGGSISWVCRNMAPHISYPSPHPDLYPYLPSSCRRIGD